MRCPLCDHSFGPWRLLRDSMPDRPLRCDRCRALLVVGPRTWPAALVDRATAATVFVVALRVLEAPSWRTVVALAAFVLVGAWLDTRLAVLEPVRGAQPEPADPAGGGRANLGARVE